VLTSVDPLRDLLFGMLALQIGLIEQGQLTAAFQGWVRDKGRPLAEHLVSRGDLDDDDRVAVEALVERHLKKNDGDPQKSLAAVNAGRSTRESLAGLGDAEIEASIAHLGAASTQDGEDADRTASYAVGTATSDGQRFRILRPHARGGLGAVFVALDGELHREVALKQILDSHADDPASRRRFLLEAEVTGGLEHPGIVPVYGLGTYGDGRPYYAMRFIRGDSLKEAIERFHGDQALKDDPGRLSLELRMLLRRFTDVCNAIEYAHSRGVLHRDIKPGNIIVGKHGETLVVDWGLAKVGGRPEAARPSGERPLAPSSVSGSAETLPGSVIGSPAYMSPEQADGELDRLGPRSDVYSLGATLYCLLTGKPPIEGDVANVIRAAQRGDFRPPHQVNPSIDRGLEAVCLKAMALKAPDRYATPSALADDIERWMADEPVSAWREPFAHQARRWMRRRRTTITAASAAVLVALIGLSGILLVQSHANSDLSAANQRERDRFELAMEAIQTFHTGVSEDVLLKQNEFHELRTKLLRGARDFYGKLQGLLEGHADRRSRAALGKASGELGERTSQIGSKQEALAIHRRALALRRSLAAEADDTGGEQADVGKSLIDTATALAETGDLTEALKNYEEGRALLERLVRSRRDATYQEDLAKCIRGIGQIRSQTGHTSEALAAYDQARQMQETLSKAFPDVARYRATLAQSYNNIGYLLSTTKATPQALAAYEQARAIQAELVASNPSVTRFHADLGLSLINIGNLLSETGRRGEGIAVYERATQVLEALVKANPNVSMFQRDLARCYNNIGYALSMTGPPAQALTAYERGRTIREALAKANPTASEFQRELARSYNNIGYILSDEGRIEDALASFARAKAVYEGLAEASPNVTRYQADVAFTHFSIGNTLAQTKRVEEAMASFERAKVIQETLATANPEVTQFAGDLAASYCSIGELRAESGRSSEAITSYQRAIAIQEGLVKSNPDVQIFQSDLTRSLIRTGNLLAQNGSRDDALALLEKSRALCEALTDANPTVLPYQGDLARTLCGLAPLLNKMGRASQALSAYERAQAIQERLAIAQPDNAYAQAEAGTTLVDIGMHKARHADPAEGLRLCRLALERLERSHSSLRVILQAQARAYAQIGRLLGLPSKRRTGDQSDTSLAHLDAAMSLLRRATASGFRDTISLSTDAAFDPLRSRPDYKSLILDLEFPADPFAHGD
jgi:eukaryotic-like serine/threonine-protein kinase